MSHGRQRCLGDQREGGTRMCQSHGSWRIAARRSLVDLVLHGSAALLQLPAFRAQGYPKGTRDTSDSSYQRPLDLDVPPPARW